MQELLKRLQDRHVECAEAVAKKGAADAASAAAVSGVDQVARSRRKRCDVSEEEFERRHALVQDENFWGVAARNRQCNAFQVERESQLLV